MTIKEIISRYIRDQWVRCRRALIFPEAQEELLSGAQLKFFEPGTSTPATVYMDADCQWPHPHPVVASGAGEFPPIYFDPAKQVSAQLESMDGVILCKANAQELCASMVDRFELRFENPNAPCDERKWIVECAGSVVTIRTVSDAGIVHGAVTVTRVGTRIAKVEEPRGGK